MSEHYEPHPDAIEMTREEAEALGEQWWRAEDPDDELNEEQERLVDKTFEYCHRAFEFQEAENYVLAARYYQKAVDLLETANLGNNKYKVGKYMDLGISYYHASNYDMANRYLLRALEGYQARATRDDLSISVVYTFLGHLYRDQEQFEIAIEFYKKALEVNISAGFRQFAACTQNRIARCYRDAGDPDEAIEYYSMTLDMIDVVNMDTVGAYTGLACIYRDDEMFDEAIECHQSAIETAEQLSGAESFEIADEYNQIAITYRHMGELTRAIEYYQRAIEIFEAQENVNRRKVARVLENLAMAYVYAEQMGNALECFGRLLPMLREIDGEDDPHVAEIEEYMVEIDQSYHFGLSGVKPS